MEKSDTFKSISVLILSPYPHVHGGVSVFAETLKRSLVNCRIHSLYIGNKGGENENIIVKTAHMTVSLLKLVLLVHKHDFDVIHINPSLNYKSLLRDGLFLLALYIMRFRHIVLYFHGWDRSVENRIRQSPWLRRIFAALLNGTQRIMVLAPEFRRSLIDMGVKSERMTYARTLFDGTLFDGVHPPSASQRTILYMSRFDTRKGVHELLSAFIRIAAEFPDVHLVFAGDGTENRRLQARAKASAANDRIRFCGHVRGREKAELLLGCDIFALPTYFPEGLPVALLEAMAAGKPLLTAKAGGIPSRISEPENGIVLDEVTEDAVTDALRRLLGDRSYCEETGRRNRDYAWNNFEGRIVTAEIEGIYHAISGYRS